MKWDFRMMRNYSVCQKNELARNIISRSVALLLRSFSFLLHILSLLFPSHCLLLSPFFFSFLSFFFFYMSPLHIYTLSLPYSLFFFFNDPAPPEISPFPLPDALPI